MKDSKRFPELIICVIDIKMIFIGWLADFGEINSSISLHNFFNFFFNLVLSERQGKDRDLGRHSGNLEFPGEFLLQMNYSFLLNKQKKKSILP